MDPAVACERLEHSDGGGARSGPTGTYLRAKRDQAAKLDVLIRESLDKNGTEDEVRVANPHQNGVAGMGAPGIEPTTSRV
jgi:hypothetical protein